MAAGDKMNELAHRITAYRERFTPEVLALDQILSGPKPKLGSGVLV
jgi:hypothetical protein